jgi:hypothetical protein
MQFKETDSESIKRRFHILLESYYDPYSGDGDLPYRLRQMIRYSSGKKHRRRLATIAGRSQILEQPRKNRAKKTGHVIFLVNP